MTTMTGISIKRKPDPITLSDEAATKVTDLLAQEGVTAAVVSMPSWEVFEHQTRAYRESVLPPSVTARVAVEQASTFGWERYVGTSGHVVGMNTFGASAPLKELQRKFGFEPDHVIVAAKEQLANSRDGNR